MKTKQIALISLLLPVVLGVIYIAKQKFLKPANNFEYNEFTAKELAFLSMASYCNTSMIPEWKCGETCELTPHGISDIVMFSNPTLNTSGFVGYSKFSHAITVVFRGTIPWSILNWATDIDTAKVLYPKCNETSDSNNNNNQNTANSACYVHKGFYTSFLGIEEQIKSEFLALRAQHPKAKVYVTGHSLGGAIATHAIPLLYELNNNRPIDAFYTFGQPRVGDANFSNWFNGKNFSLAHARITNNKDPVPHLPPAGFPFKFNHVSNEVFYIGASFVKCAQSEDNLCSNGVAFPIDANDHMTYFGQDWTKHLLTCQ